MKIFRVFALLLALLMVLTSVIACTKKTNEPDSQSSTGGDTEKSVETDKWGQEVIDDGISDDLDFGGKTINVLVRSGEGFRYEWYTEEPSAAIDVEVFNRNSLVAEELNITWNFIVENDSDQDKYNEKIMNVGRSGMGGIDIVNSYRHLAANANLIPFYMNVRSDKFTYLDLDKPYWNQYVNEASESFGRQYFFIGDMNLSVYDRSIVTFFNKAKLHDNTGMTPDELYGLVLDGGWTYERLYEIVSTLYNDIGDLSGDRDFYDFYGLTSINASEATDGLLYSWDLRLTSKDENDGTHSLVSGADRTKMIDAFGKMNDLLYSEGVNLHEKAIEAITQFTGGNALFMIDIISHTRATTTMLADMVDGYGVIPTPKYDERQTTYYTGVQDAHNIMSVMYHGMGDYDMISAVLELTASVSYSTVRPYYVETIIKTRQLDALSSKCFDHVLNGVKIDWADIYNHFLNNVRRTFWRGPFNDGKGSDGAITDAFGTYEETITEKISELDAWLVTQY